MGIRELQQNASKVVGWAASGEEIEITDRGRAVARMVPLAGGALERLARAGRLRPATRSMSDLPALIEVAPGTASASEILARLRAGDR